MSAIDLAGADGTTGQIRVSHEGKRRKKRGDGVETQKSQGACLSLMDVWRQSLGFGLMGSFSSVFSPWRLATEQSQLLSHTKGLVKLKLNKISIRFSP
jgi:hypothetical protein